MSTNGPELRDQTQLLLDGPLKHIRGAAIAALLLPLASVAAAPASAQSSLCPSGGVCGFVYNDASNNGTIDAGETGIPNAQVTVHSDGQPDVVAFTNANGFYSVFVPGGAYTVTVQTLTNGQASPIGPNNVGVSNGPGSSIAPSVLVTFAGTEADFGFVPQTTPPACTIPAANEVISSTSWNKFSIPFGKAPVVWVNAQFKPAGVPTATNSSIRFTGVSFVLNGVPYPMPDGVVNFDINAPAASSTAFSGTPGTSSALWTTTINPNFISDENFFIGAAIPVDAAIAGGGQATMQFTTQTDDTGLSFSWQWSAAVYTYWPSDWNQALIQAYHGNGEHADTPNNTQVQKSLIQGPRGGGGSNFTGSWSATGHGTCR